MDAVTRRERVRDGVVAGVFAGVLSGAPSTAYALARRRDPLESTLAAGSVLLPSETRRGRLAAAAVPVHAAISLAWALALARVLPLRRPALEGMAAGLVIAVLDLGVLARPFPRIRALPLGPQLADHVAYGVVAATALARRRDRK